MTFKPCLKPPISHLDLLHVSEQTLVDLFSNSSRLPNREFT